MMMNYTKRLCLTAVLLIGFSGVLHCIGDRVSANGLSVFQKATQNARDTKSLPTIFISELPVEALDTLKRIKQGGPFPYPKDGTTFRNREKRLPVRERDYYKEYTIKTPGVRSRGARRIVAGSRGEFYYTHDHYKTFRLIME